MRRSCLVMVVALLVCLVGPRVARADLYDYVKKDDKSFSWKLAGKGSVPLLGGTVYEIDLVSQTWQKITWKHKLLIVVPPKVNPTATMFLWNQGGTPSDGTKALAMSLAMRMQAPVAFLFGIPNQPLLENRREDALIAETFVRYLETQDGDWPLLFPMVKSLVRAMDAIQAFAMQEWKQAVTSFIVSGGSKRGWTTWLTAAADSRVKAIIPMVIDTLNMPRQLPHQLESYGAYSEMIRDYTNRKLVPMPDTAAARKLWSMVDPWTHRDKVKVPTLIINGTNDPYWTQDALNLYWDDLKMAKSVLYIPNVGHDLTRKTAKDTPDPTRVGNAIGAFGRAHIHGKAWPKMTWKHEQNEGKYRLSVDSDIAPKTARLWVAEAPTRDFRKATWKEQNLDLKKNAVVAEVTAPEKGCRVFLVEYEFAMDKLSHHLSTQLRIVGTPEKKAAAGASAD